MHATHLDWEYAHNKQPTPAPDSEDSQLLSELGTKHEQAYLERLEAEGRQVVRIDRGDHAPALTRAALRSGAEIIYQGAFVHGNWTGYVDFLERCDTPSDLGPFSYDVVDTKLRRTPSPNHILQLVVYSDLLAKVQGLMPVHAHLIQGDSTRTTHRLAEFTDYVQGLRAQLDAFVNTPIATVPIPCEACELCRWRDHCKAQWKAEDSLYQVANVRKSQVQKINGAGISTMAGLAAHTGDIPRLAAATLEKVRTQARMQVEGRDSNANLVRARTHTPGKGFDLLPSPDAGDLFYDIEGDPHYREGPEEGLEYLHGVWDGTGFTAFWAHDHAQERMALKQLFEYFQNRLERFPQAHIYHYAPYEITALRRLTMRYGHGEEQMDSWLRENRFVDLFAIVRNGIVTSLETYKLKDLEVFFQEQREGEVKTSGGSIVAYERWCKLDAAGDPAAPGLRKEIEDYNRIDCESTEKLRDWILPFRPADASWAELGASSTEFVDHRKDEHETVQDQLNAAALDEDRQRLLYNLVLFHDRERKVAAWAVYDALQNDHDELSDDMDCLAGMVANGFPYPVQRSVARNYTYPEQETKLRAGKSANVAVETDGKPEFRSVQITKLERENRAVTIKVGLKRADALGSLVNLIPGFGLPTKDIDLALRAVIDDQCTQRRNRAADDLLSRAAPRFTGPSPLSGPSRTGLEQLIDAVRAMDCTVLPVQGPPGTGKTYVTARAVLSLVKSGARVAVTSNSHEAIRNVLLACDQAARERYAGLTRRGVSMVHKIGTDPEVRGKDRVPCTKSNKDIRLARSKIVGGTAWLLCREEQRNAFDYLFVDEAGQVSLANILAMTTCARNVVLIGDPCQLPQVIQGGHPSPADESCLNWMLGERRLLEPGRGVFLGQSWRMHPDLCRYISDQFYAGRVEAHPDNVRQAIRTRGLPSAGAFRVHVEHEGRAQICDEEVQAISQIIDRLLAGTWTDRTGATRDMTPSDIIVVAPYNAQVNALTDALKGIRVGTVDKFQGQEAPVALISMTSSSAEETPRGLDFLLSRERINVALSRGKALSLAFCSPRLLESRCRTVEHVRLVNALCALQPLNP